VQIATEYVYAHIMVDGLLTVATPTICACGANHPLFDEENNPRRRKKLKLNPENRFWLHSVSFGGVLFVCLFVSGELYCKSL
jgi:hypothetical protein